ncbi:aryl hydrocarbon receptor-like isoform X1 [Mauremys reevesii]|uniref:aryl hydrocarbon receptor-like isoform X1 n=2 Tax=Mauremys reevesii TaxID=260615 RepID=UPI00193ECC97|nr:aryl hydrocarbon receptor-like isoform X1 [Mauremys reevesii]
MYAGRKRRKPVQRTVKPPPPEGVKSNPSKRHRDRLNSELERLASLLPFPEEVISTLDKLSILRLSVSYLRAKNFFNISLKSHCSKAGVERDGDHDNGRTLGLADRIMPEGELLLQALNGFVLVVTSEGMIFYCSHTIQDYLGFHQTDVMHQSVFELIHTEDQQEFRRNLHWALNPPPTPESEPSPDGEKSISSSVITYKPGQLPPENSSFLERSFVCRFRCLLDNSSGFLALNLQGRLKFLHGQNKRSEDGSLLPPQLALFAISTPLQPPSILEVRTKHMLFRTKHKLDFTPVACDAKGKIVLGYTEAELRVRGTGYQFIHAADMLHCAENHVRMIKTGESGLTVFRLLTKENQWKWVQANARLVYKNGKPDYIIATQRPLVDEEGGEHLRKRSMHLPFTFATGEALLYQISYPLPGFPDPFHSKGKNNRSKKNSQSKGGRSQKDNVDPNSLLGAMMRQDEAVYVSHPASTSKHSFSSNLFSHLGESGLFGTREENWNAVANPLSSGENGPKQELDDLRQGDPLLTTLDSLSISSDENCSNNELFSALEGLGLNAEDLELLLLDERMVRVEMDLDYTPSLNDLLTNNEILSYIHGSLVNKGEDEPTGEQQACSSSDPGQNPSQDLLVYPSQMPEKGSQCSPQPPPQNQQSLILHLPQQMQQHIVTQNQQSSQPWEQLLPSVLSQPTPSLVKQAAEDSSLQWRPPAGTAKLGLSPFVQSSLGHQQQSALWVRPHGSNHLHQPIEIPYQHKQHGQQLESNLHAVQGAHQPLLQQSLPCSQQNRIQAHTEPQLKQKPTLVGTTWQGYSYRPANQPPRGLPAQIGSYGVEQELSSQLCPAQVPNTGVSTIHFYLNGLSNMEIGDRGASQEEMTPYSGSVPPSSYQVISAKQLTPVPSESQYLCPNSALDHFVNIHGQQEASIHSYGTHTLLLRQDNTHKPENDCVLTNANVGYPRDCLLPNRNPASSDELHSCTELLPNHSKPSSSGFYL